ncbi:hypothetical protein ACBJ59_41360 [Nonomuraea sp. MTCD27]|uniref:hypothetical protein n=1 Tax=Nonomuraea sp. MTCD27 TaxID=1676747 RepID=UPI0035C0BC0D
MGETGRRRRPAGRHAAGRSRRARRRGARGRLVAGVLALTGGAVVLLGVNGWPFGASAGSGAARQPGTVQERGPAEPDAGSRGSGAQPGKGTGKPGAATGAGAEVTTGVETRELQRSESPRPAAAPEEAGAAEPGMVAGTTAPSTALSTAPSTAAEDVLADGPAPGDGDDYRADGPSRHTDQQAAEYFRTQWGPDDKALKRLKDIRTVGGYLRIYTDLPDSADNSLTAVTLCERGLAYLHSRGVPNPVVFVHSKFGGNGNPVLANILGPGDRSCRVTHPAPN